MVLHAFGLPKTKIFLDFAGPCIYKTSAFYMRSFRPTRGECLPYRGRLMQ